ncbi:MAG: argininosuccinate synthase [Actinomycetota bacterium]|jgi:argininosuccinate synthase|nr:argininosuccinate synthase [Actinomycetota bacterium]
MKKVVLAYSGGLDTSVAVAWLREQGYDVVAVAVDVGQPGDLHEAIVRAEQLGAVDARLVDARERYASSFVLPALQANALYQGRYPLVSALSRPLISEILIEVAKETGATAVAHGCTGKGNDQVRFEVSLSALAPEIEVLAPVRDWGMNRDETISYAQERDLPVVTTRKSPYSIDENLWGRSIECGVLEDPWNSPPEDIYELTSSPGDAPEPVDVEIGFDKGIPVSIDGEALGLLNAVESLGKIAGSYGFGRIDMIEDRLVGIKSREVYEAPAALALIAAHQDLENMTLERSVAREKRRLEATWTQLVYEGLWFSPLRTAIDRFIESTSEAVTGDVRVRFAGGSCLPVGRRSPNALYDHGLATYDHEDSFRHSDAEGFIRLWGLPAVQWSKVQGSSGTQGV